MKYHYAAARLLRTAQQLNGTLLLPLPLLYKVGQFILFGFILLCFTILDVFKAIQINVLLSNCWFRRYCRVAYIFWKRKMKCLKNSKYIKARWNDQLLRKSKHCNQTMKFLHIATYNLWHRLSKGRQYKKVAFSTIHTLNTNLFLKGGNCRPTLIEKAYQCKSFEISNCCSLSTNFLWSIGLLITYPF